MTKFSKIVILGVAVVILITVVFFVFGETDSGVNQKYLEIKKEIKNEKVVNGQESEAVNDFKSCVLARYPISQSESFGGLYRVCKISNEKIFQEEVSVFLKKQRGIEITTPINEQEVQDKVTLRGKIKNTRFMQNIWITVWKTDGEYSGYSNGAILIPVPSDESFETELTLPFGTGGYDIFIEVPTAEKHYGDDVAVHVVAKIHVNSVQ